MHRLLAVLLLCVTSAAAGDAAVDKTWLYRLELVPRLHAVAAWTDADRKTVGEHFEHLKGLTAQGVVVFGGRTQEPESQTFGIVVFNAADEESARHIMTSDPAVRDGVMKATLHPFFIAFERAPAATPQQK